MEFGRSFWALAAVFLVLLAPSVSSLDFKDFYPTESKINPYVSEAFESGEGEVDVSVILKGAFSDETDSHVSRERFERILSSVRDGEMIKDFYPHGFVARLSRNDVERLARYSDVEYIEMAPVVTTTLGDATKIINVEKVWDEKLFGWGETYTGKGQTACLIDTGVDFTHPDLQDANALPGGMQLDCYNLDQNGNCVMTSNVQDLNGHGTQMAGILTASGGKKGVAPDSKIISLKVFEGSSNTFESLLPVIKAIDWCTKNAQQYGISAISMSLGTAILFTGECDSFSPSTAFFINEANKNGIAAVVSTGNQANPGAIALPSCMSSAIPVSATDKQDVIASFANRNSLVKLFAPGKNVETTKSGGGYGYASGTSVSTPMVAGAIMIINQIMMGVNGVQTATPLQIEDSLYENGYKFPQSGTDYRRIDVGNTTKEYDSKVKLSKSKL